MKKAKLIAFYFPQYHPIQENDLFWGEGFTDWWNVKRVKRHVPTELGYYDLRDPLVLPSQAKLAREFGIHGFCYFHYWFSGRRVLNLPIDQMLSSRDSDFPFCLCWANENWTRAWDGKENAVLLAQEYSREDDLAHIEWLCTAFRDPRYLRVKGKPIFLIYHADELPNPLGTTTLWRKEAKRLGVGEIYLAKVKSFSDRGGLPRESGFDGIVDFQPDWTVLGRVEGWKSKLPRKWRPERVISYSRFVDGVRERLDLPATLFPCVTPGWDNTARAKGRATILSGSTPDSYGRWLRQAIQSAKERDLPEPMVFINAWNEWAEGNYLEPSHRWGRAYLEATREALEDEREKEKLF